MRGRNLSPPDPMAAGAMRVAGSSVPIGDPGQSPGCNPSNNVGYVTLLSAVDTGTAGCGLTMGEIGYY